jgi:hypothetical protein
MNQTKHDVEWIAIDDIITDEDNPNVMGPEAFAGLTHLIKERGFLQPVLVTKDADGKPHMADGHHRMEAAKLLGYTHIPAVIGGAEVMADRFAVGVGMNRLRGELDLAKVAAGLVGLGEAALGLTGFSQDELDTLLASTEEAGDDMIEAVPPPEDEPPPEDGEAKAYVLEIAFDDREMFKKAKRGLKKAAGKGKELRWGLMRLLGEEQEEESKS